MMTNAPRQTARVKLDDPMVAMRAQSFGRSRYVLQKSLRRDGATSSSKYDWISSARFRSVGSSGKSGGSGQRDSISSRMRAEPKIGAPPNTSTGSSFCPVSKRTRGT